MTSVTKNKVAADTCMSERRTSGKKRTSRTSAGKEKGEHDESNADPEAEDGSESTDHNPSVSDVKAHIGARNIIDIQKYEDRPEAQYNKDRYESL